MTTPPDPLSALRALIEKWTTATQKRLHPALRGVGAEGGDLDADGFQPLTAVERGMLRQCASELAALLPQIEQGQQERLTKLEEENAAHRNRLRAHIQEVVEARAERDKRHELQLAAERSLAALREEIARLRTTGHP